MADFATALLSSLGARNTPENLRFINAWVRAEGTKAAYNPLATTQSAPGATSFNSVNVRNYPDFQTGLAATVKTLNNGYYGPIVSGLRSGKATATQLAQAVASSPWGTGSGVLRVLGSNGGAATTPASPPVPSATALPSTPSAPTSTPMPNIAGALLSSLGQSPGAQLSSIMGAVAATPPPTTIKVPGTSASIPASPYAQPPAAASPPGVPATKGTSAVVNAATKWLGTPYSWGGGGPSGPSLGFGRGANTKGFDCSSLLQYAYAQEGVAVPRVTYDQWKTGQAVPTQNLRPGDAVFFNMGSKGPEHVGIYMGGGKFIEAPHTGAQVRVSDLSSRSDYLGARRYG